MRNLFLIIAMSLSVPALAWINCDGPQTSAACFEPPAAQSLPTAPCFGEYGCAVAQTRLDGQYGIVWLTLPNGYAQAGISGPCWSGDCPDMLAQAQAEAELKLKNAIRYQRWQSE